jgi:signal transduction histidine kinase
MSNVVFLLDTVPDASPKLAQYAALLREQIRLSQRIISDLLDSARDSARAGVPAESPTDVREMVERLLNRAAIPASVRVEVLAQADLPRVVLDADRVGQIIWNLLSNAVQAMPDGGTLTITADIRDGRLSLAIRDSGPGVATEERERIFQPLYTTKTDGVGLGLSISREFARANGGDLYVEGDGPGARFVLELPVTPV